MPFIFRSLSSMIILCGLCLFSDMAIAETNTSTALLKTAADSTNMVLKVTDSGLVPSTLKLGKAGGSVFFLNNSSDSLLNVEVEYGAHPGYCATGKMEMQKDGIFRSRAPLAPKTFLSICFPQPGTYPVRVLGLRSQPKGLTGTVIVE